MTDFEKQLIYHCSATLLGLKEANLFSFPIEKLKDYKKEIKNHNETMNPFDIYLEYLYCCSKRIFIIVYRKSKLLSYLKDKKVYNFLITLKYPNIQKENLSAVWLHLRKRIHYLKEFPHEIGFFLGYPPEDVFEYIHQKGLNFKLCGYWKVYNNEEKALEIFNTYNKCREMFLQKATAGIPIYQMIGVA